MSEIRRAKIFINNKTGLIDKIEFDGTDTLCKNFYKGLKDFLEQGDHPINIELESFVHNEEEEKVEQTQEETVKA